MPPRSRTTKTADAVHAATRVPGHRIDHWNLPLPDPEGDGFFGDRASHTTFHRILERLRRRERTGRDPFADDAGTQRLDEVMLGGDPDGAHLVHLAVEEYARNLADVARCFLARPEWEGVERIVMGGSMPQSGHGALAVRRAARLLRQARVQVELTVLSHDPDEGGLLGWVPLAPADVRRFDGFLAVDIGGTNFRCGIVTPRFDRAKDGSKAEVYERLHWRHAEDDPDRGESVQRIAGMLNGLATLARTTGLKLAPFVGIACPGQVEPDGRLSQGTQNLPGDWDIPFDLPKALRSHLDRIGGRAPLVLMHNDAVVQGLCEHAAMRDVKRWAVFTVGTGLGNASYTRL